VTDPINIDVLTRRECLHRDFEPGDYQADQERGFRRGAVSAEVNRETEAAALSTQLSAHAPLPSGI
jgi:hypothetical protein